jgi:hypothetical protein
MISWLCWLSWLRSGWEELPILPEKKEVAQFITDRQKELRPGHAVVPPSLMKTLTVEQMLKLLVGLYDGEYQKHCLGIHPVSKLILGMNP